MSMFRQMAATLRLATMLKTVSTFVNAINDSPVISINDATVVEGSRVTIDSSVLSGFDIDDSAEQLTIHIQTPPVNGRLELSTDPGVVVTTFTQADVAAGRLVYFHHGNEAASDSFSFQVADGGEDGSSRRKRNVYH